MQDYLLTDVFLKGIFKKSELQLRRPQKYTEMKSGNLFLSMKLHFLCSGQSCPFGTVQSAPAVFHLALLLKGQPCPERQASTNSAAPRLRVEGASTRPHLYKDHIYTLVGAAVGMFHVEGSAATMAELGQLVPREVTQGVESTEGLVSGGLREKAHCNGNTKYAGLGPPNPNVKPG